MARTRFIRVRVDDDEYAALAEKGAAVGGMSRLLRDHFGKVRIRDRDTERQRLAMLNRLNANLNMIARWCNVHQSQADTVQIMVCLADVRREIGRMLAVMERR